MQWEVGGSLSPSPGAEIQNYNISEIKLMKQNITKMKIMHILLEINTPSTWTFSVSAGTKPSTRTAADYEFSLSDFYY